MKNLPAVWETQFPSLGWEDPLKKGMATYSSILASTIAWTEESCRLQSMGPTYRMTLSLSVTIEWKQTWLPVVDIGAHSYRVLGPYPITSGPRDALHPV